MKVMGSNPGYLLKPFLHLGRKGSFKKEKEKEIKENLSKGCKGIVDG